MAAMSDSEGQSTSRGVPHPGARGHGCLTGASWEARRRQLGCMYSSIRKHPQARTLSQNKQLCFETIKNDPQTFLFPPRQLQVANYGLTTITFVALSGNGRRPKSATDR